MARLEMMPSMLQMKERSLHPSKRTPPDVSHQTQAGTNEKQNEQNVSNLITLRLVLGLGLDEAFFLARALLGSSFLPTAK